MVFAQKAYQVMSKQDGGGCIINISSQASMPVGSGGSLVPYGAAKAGLNHMTRSLAVAWGRKVRVNCVSLGWVETEAMADLHIRVNPAMPSQQSHAIAHEVARRLREQEPSLKDITVHVEPERAKPAELTQSDVTLQLRRLADGLGLAVHDVWVYERDGALFVSVHLEMDGALTLHAAHQLATTLEERARSEIPAVIEVTTHIEPLGQIAHSAHDSATNAELGGAGAPARPFGDSGLNSQY